VVSGWRIDRKDKQWTRKFPSMLANRLISWVSGVNLHDYGCCLKAYRREVIKDVQLYGEMHRFIPIYAAHQAGARVTELPVLHHPRTMGVSKFGKLSRTFEVVLDLITIKYMEDYRTKPMHLFGYVGFISFGVAALALLLSIALKISGTGFFQTPLITIFFLAIAFGVQFILLGLLSETLMRTYYESQRKPTYTVGELINIEEGARATGEHTPVPAKATSVASA
jgi:dolichol-phosphate mannosyltransferase